MNASDLQNLIAQRRATQPPPPPPESRGWEPCRVRKTLEQVTSRVLSIPEPRRQSPEQLERHRREQIAAERSERWRSFAEALGPRYLGCRFANFTIEEHSAHATEMHDVVGEFQKYARDLPNRVEDGQGLIAYGPSGGGKDHLLTALSHTAITSHNMHVRWTNGVDFYRQVRDGFTRNRRGANR